MAPIHALVIVATVGLVAPVIAVVLAMRATHLDLDASKRQIKIRRETTHEPPNARIRARDVPRDDDRG